MFELSASIKTVVQNINGTTLPTGFGDTLDLARAIADGTSSFDADLELLSPGTLDFAREKLLTDGHATLNFRADEAPGVYVAVNNDYVYAVFDNGTALVEYFDDNAMSTIPSWNITNDGKLRINYFGFERAADSLTLLGGGPDALHLVTDLTDLSGATAARTAATAMKYAFAGGFDAASVTGTYVDPHAPQNDLVFQAGGAGYSVNRADTTQQSPFVWSVNSDGRLMVDYTNSAISVELISLASASQPQVLGISRIGGQWPSLAVGAW